MPGRAGPDDSVAFPQGRGLWRSNDLWCLDHCSIAPVRFNAMKPIRHSEHCERSGSRAARYVCNACLIHEIERGAALREKRCNPSISASTMPSIIATMKDYSSHLFQVENSCCL